MANPFSYTWAWLQKSNLAGSQSGIKAGQAGLPSPHPNIFLDSHHKDILPQGWSPRQPSFSKRNSPIKPRFTAKGGSGIGLWGIYFHYPGKGQLSARLHEEPCTCLQGAHTPAGRRASELLQGSVAYGIFMRLEG